MSSYVCSDNSTFSCIIELAMKHETITNPDLLAKRLYLLNVESVNQNYNLKDINKEEYDKYFSFMANIQYEPQPDASDANRVYATSFWLYQSCEGNCEEDPLFKAIRKLRDEEVIAVAKTIRSNFSGDWKDAERIVFESLNDDDKANYGN